MVPFWPKPLVSWDTERDRGLACSYMWPVGLQSHLKTCCHCSAFPHFCKNQSPNFLSARIQAHSAVLGLMYQNRQKPNLGFHKTFDFWLMTNPSAGSASLSNDLRLDA